MPEYRDQWTQLNGDDIMIHAYRCSRFKRKVFILTAMICGCMCFMLYTLTFSCCAALNPNLDGRTEFNQQHAVLDNRLIYATESSLKKFRLTGDNLEENGAKKLKIDNPLPQTYSAHFHRKTQETDENYLADDSEGTEIYDSDSDYSDSYGRRSNELPSKHGMTRTRKNATRKLPKAIIIGVKKGGTRALLEFIRLHPDVRAPGPETHFFDRHYNRGLHWYRNQMPPTIDGQITIEKTPSYFITREVPRRIFNMSKDTKIILVVRDPVIRAISDYTQTASKRPVSKSFEEMAILDNSTGMVDTSWGALRIGVYAKHLEKWLKYFPLNQICIVSGEGLISDPAAELRKVQDFLGLKRVITDKHFYFNETKGFPCLKKPEGSGNPRCLGKTKGRTHPHVDPKVLERLRDFYRPFNAKFYQMTNQNFGWP